MIGTLDHGTHTRLFWSSFQDDNSNEVLTGYFGGDTLIASTNALFQHDEIPPWDRYGFTDHTARLHADYHTTGVRVPVTNNMFQAFS